MKEILENENEVDKFIKKWKIDNKWTYYEINE